MYKHVNISHFNEYYAKHFENRILKKHKNMMCYYCFELVGRGGGKIVGFFYALRQGHNISLKFLCYTWNQNKDALKKKYVTNYI